MVDIQLFGCAETCSQCTLQSRSDVKNSLCFRQHAYVALKAFECNSTEGQSETEIYHHLNSLNIVDHAGVQLIRTTSDSFQLLLQSAVLDVLFILPSG